MFPEAIIIGALSFLAGLLFKAYWAKKEEDRWRKLLYQSNDDRHHAVYRWNVTSCRIGAIRRMATQVLEERGGEGGPYRSDPSKLREVLEHIRDKANESLKEVALEVGCFKSLEEAAEYVAKLDDSAREASEPHGDSLAYPIIVRHKEWDGTCWHVVYGSDDQGEAPEKCEKCAHREGWRENECGIGNPAWPDAFCEAFSLSKPPINADRMKYSVDQETGVVTIEYETLDEVEPTEIPPPGMRGMST